jgi:hypothetical protein
LSITCQTKYSLSLKLPHLPSRSFIKFECILQSLES